ncbi:RAN GTPase-activating protein 2 [Andrographis paniculata]|uniref:RAN GTPase-activating protein 2 n=1 Tax=Andrographis paniculata TaxID=175694 RepID=UPI0021E892C9|nr:RAN GTPase-activating protein 2 [Andrographis paniculata]XP_051127878.1 RAN GTPase-activating protein 2 [Andrographis paniculata]
MDAKTSNGERRHITIKLWPPSQNTRKMLVERMTNNLSTPTIFTQKYGTFSNAEALIHAERIEELAFSTANQHYEQEPDGDGSAAVQLYAKECSKLILDVLKGGAGSVKIEEKEIPKSEDDSTPRETVFDISKGQRAFIEEDEARTLLAPLKAPGNSYTKICFSNRSFGLGAANVAGPILASIKAQLKEVDLSDFVAGRPEVEALEVMNIFSEALEGSKLKYLNISDNALGEKGVRAFGKLLKSQPGLEELYLMNDGISKEAARAVRELVPSTDKLRVLHFHNNMTGDEGAVAISKILDRCPSLEDFRCSSTRVGSEGGTALSEALAKCTNLKKLDLRDNIFGVEAGLKLSEAISKLECLEEIYLSYLNLEDDGAIAIADALKDSAPSLEVLDMAGNDITVEAAPALAACIGKKTSLVKLNLSENDLKDDGAIQIVKMFGDGHSKLKDVDLSQNSLRRAAARLVARAVVGLPGFGFLNVDGNAISDDGVDELKEIFKLCPEKLGPLDENDPDGEDLDEKESADGDGDEELGEKLKKLDVNEGEE